MTNIENAWRPFEPSREAVEAAEAVDDTSRCAVCGATLHDPKARIMCVRGRCSVRRFAGKPYAHERAVREYDEAYETHQRALRNGMPPSGRWA